MNGNKDRGFTLVEVALSIVVVALGVLAVFALISSGLAHSRKAVAETYAATFANDVFTSLRAESLKASDRGETEWEKFWGDFAKGATSVTLSAETEWADNTTIVRYPGRGLVPVVKFRNYSDRSKEDTDIINHALRYKLRIGTTSEFAGTPTNIHRRTAYLQIWEGEFGQLSDPLVFYTEFENPGDL
jgi:type II secretory pathway pseudopilin PulG